MTFATYLIKLMPVSMDKNINDYFKKSDLKQVKDLLKSLDLEVESKGEELEVSHQAFYNTFSRPDKEEESPDEKRKILQKALIELLEEDKNISIFWDVDADSTMIQILIDGQDWLNSPVKDVEQLFSTELENILHFPYKNLDGYSKGTGKLQLNSSKELLLNYSSEEEYNVSEQLEDADLWTKKDLPDYIITNRFFDNKLSFAAQFEGIRRGFNAEIKVNESGRKEDFYFAPELEISSEAEKEFAELLLNKVDKMALERHQYNFLKIKYLPTLLLNGQISSDKIAILNLEVTYMIFEKQEGQTFLFKVVD
jgi:hypothetical protein